MAEFPPEKRDVLLDLISTGRKIEAIKVLREETGLGLKEAKDKIDALEASMSSNASGNVASAPEVQPALTGARMLPQQKLAALSELIFQNRKLEAIKCYREWTRADLRESKDQIQALETALRINVPEKFASSPRRGCLAAILGLSSLTITYWIVHA